jgi:Cutinase
MIFHGQRSQNRTLLSKSLSLVLAGGVATTTFFATTGTAQALGGYHTSAYSIRVRAGASTQTAQISSILTAGTGIDIACQTGGESVTAAGFGTSPIWDKLNGYGGGYISDLFVQETPYAQFDPRLPRCGTPPPTYVTTAYAPVHSAPSFNATTVGSIGAGAAVTITCQNNGTKYGGSFIWDRIGSGYVSDIYINGTPFNAFDAHIPRCGLGYQPVDCHKVLFLGARGSGEPFGAENLGDPNSPVQVTRNILASRGVSLDVAGTIYPAQSVSILPWDVTDYFAGVTQGTHVLLANLRTRTDGNVCGWQNTKSVLVGYSQGALVVGNAIQQMTSQERATIVGVVTYGNPRYHQGVNGGSGSSGNGILGAGGAYPNGVNNRSRDYCRQDIVCKAGSTNKAEHMRYVTPGPQVANGSTYLASLFGH